MPVNPKYHTDFEEHGIYHIYNRTNNKESLFLNDGHRQYILKRYEEVISPFVETFAWVLLDNHFHFLIKVKSIDNISAYLKTLLNNGETLTLSEKKLLTREIEISELLVFTFKRFFQSYAQAFNKDVNRKGNLFSKRFKRVQVDLEKHLMQTVIYIHANSVKHNLTRDFTKYKWSSWHSFFGEQAGLILRDFAIDLFGGLDGFIETHLVQAQQYFDYKSEMEE